MKMTFQKSLAFCGMFFALVFTASAALGQVEFEIIHDEGTATRDDFVLKSTLKNTSKTTALGAIVRYQAEFKLKIGEAIDSNGVITPIWNTVAVRDLQWYIIGGWDFANGRIVFHTAPSIFNRHCKADNALVRCDDIANPFMENGKYTFKVVWWRRVQTGIMGPLIWVNLGQSIETKEVERDAGGTGNGTGAGSSNGNGN